VAAPTAWIKLGLATHEVQPRLVMPVFRVPNRLLAPTCVFRKRWPFRWPRCTAGRRHALESSPGSTGSWGYRSHGIHPGRRWLRVIDEHRRTPRREDDKRLVTPAASHRSALDSVGLPAVRAALDPASWIDTSASSMLGSCTPVRCLTLRTRTPSLDR
jgi:hypothetical protein